MEFGAPADHTEHHRPKTFDEIKGSILDPTGVFKYIQIDVHNSKTDQTRKVVRGYKSCGYHADILNKFEHEELSQCTDDLTCSCPGGGRIAHTPEEKKIHIYGYSQGFGLADHQITQNILE